MSATEAAGRRILVTRMPTWGGRAHPYDVVLTWIAENFPDYAGLFQVEKMPYAFRPDGDFALHTAWIQDPVQNWSMQVYEQLMLIAGACDARGIPIINRVDRLVNATKSAGARLMREAGIRTPRIAPIRNYKEFRKTLLGIPLPLFVRDDWGHQGEMLRADTHEEAAALPVERFRRPVAVELIELPGKSDGLYRKYRYIAAGDIGIPHHVQISAEWVTRGDNRVKLDLAREEELAYIAGPDPNHAVLQRARHALGLDFLAIDYAYGYDGEIVIWEANPYPYVHFSTRVLAYRNPAMHRTMAAILKMLLDAAGIPTSDKLEAQLDFARPPTTTYPGIPLEAPTNVEPATGAADASPP